MKINKPRILRKAALIAVGVFLGRGAHADTTLTFDCTPVSGNGTTLADCIPPQINNPNAAPGITNYGNFAAASSPGIAVSGFGTPNIGLTWGWTIIQRQDGSITTHLADSGGTRPGARGSFSSRIPS